MKEFVRASVLPFPLTTTTTYQKTYSDKLSDGFRKRTLQKPQCIIKYETYIGIYIIEGWARTMRWTG
jgi:hypothetical protein